MSCFLPLFPRDSSAFHSRYRSERRRCDHRTQKSRFEYLSLPCTAETTVRQVLEAFIAQYENGRWAKVLNPRKLAGATIKRWHFAEILFDDDKVCVYDFVKQAISEGELVKLTLDFVSEQQLHAPVCTLLETFCFRLQPAFCSLMMPRSATTHDAPICHGT